MGLIAEQHRSKCPFCTGMVTLGYSDPDWPTVIHTEPICMDIKKIMKGFAVGAGVAAIGLGIKKILEQENPELEGPRAPGLDASENLILQLDDSIRQMARNLIQAAYNDGINLRVTNGYRSNAEQERLYNQGRTTPGPIVTKAKAGSSWHNHRLAFDVGVVDADGKITWPNDVPLWDRIGKIGKSVGLNWGGDFVGFTDRPHFDYHRDLTIADAMAGKRPERVV